MLEHPPEDLPPGIALVLARQGFRIAGKNSSGHLPLMDGKWVRRLLGRKRVLCRIPEWLEGSCAINFVWLAERVPSSPGRLE